MAFNIIDGQNIHGVAATKAEQEALLMNAGKMNLVSHPTPIAMPGTYPPELVARPNLPEFGSKFPFKNTSSPKRLTSRQPLPRAGEKD